ncbi:Glucose/arabinose dehydrogenase, beta-propeller fold [Abditibacterium utsteinense]|uniref:Glucose/arabinose dehydrogenase, beta-propeller fold n=1 Tax=Abditibacterium utsteinense TaxID=1960156 RepID=A0A2S8SSC3_9BACT|nr:sorbosone dehydrogenase family protein [Abditibacterium utsteinense]PQV63676.1 Glucose/arabinose dehydrogenase, beta-propeller fold [Abditibacterium utsteinense]
MKLLKPFTVRSGAILSCALLSTLSGCKAPANTQAAQVETPGQKRTSSISRSEGVPNGQKTTSGLTIPRGFQIELLAEGFFVPRRLAIAPGATPARYDLFIAESKANRVSVLQINKGKVARKTTFVTGLNQPYGMAFGDSSFFVANTDAVLRFPFRTGDLSASGAGRKIADLTEGGYNQHWTRNLLFSRDQKKLFVTVGSSCNTCEENDPQRAAISAMNPDGSDKRVYASGLRNPVGVALRPGTDELWTVVNERDNLGDDVPPDYLTSVKPGAFYGWPYAYTDINGNIFPDPNYGDKTEMVQKTRAPDVPVQAHSAALGLAFYPLAGGNFPKNYRGDAFLALHGSWNRSAKTGYKIVRVDFESGKPKAVSDFVTGYGEENEAKGGRPVDVQIAPDGSLIFSDDGRGRIWRVSYDGATFGGADSG